MKWNVKKLKANDFITIEGKNITVDGVEIEVQDGNARVIKTVKNTLSRLRRDQRIEVVSGDVPEKPESPFKKKNKTQVQAQAQSEGQVPGAPARTRRSLKEEQEQTEQAQETEQQERSESPKQTETEAPKGGTSEE